MNAVFLSLSRERDSARNDGSGRLRYYREGTRDLRLLSLDLVV
jgi:hypothetical protein